MGATGVNVISMCGGINAVSIYWIGEANIIIVRGTIGIAVITVPRIHSH